jgi:hypothetical protein
MQAGAYCELTLSADHHLFKCIYALTPDIQIFYITFYKNWRQVKTEWWSEKKRGIVRSGLRE